MEINIDIFNSQDNDISETTNINIFNCKISKSNFLKASYGNFISNNKKKNELEEQPIVIINPGGSLIFQDEDSIKLLSNGRDNNDIGSDREKQRQYEEAVNNLNNNDKDNNIENVSRLTAYSDQGLKKNVNVDILSNLFLAKVVKK